ncbi:Translation initiation factor eIF-2B subunit alpha [Oopsacas minuta]|uniref:Translation initiation factor eIF2B subunit alpha n=1 Tax=Oopsacas minuta TaxID=111878 RepID=A0AAV7K7D4_9METZ|nr:Translation initiation factor eIF-2B subunit alpha [Oopsacas minuta]
MEFSDKICYTREDGVATFRQQLADEEETTPRALCAVKTLIFFLKGSKDPTISQILESLLEMQKLMEGATNSISVTSGCEIFRRFITLVSMDALDAEECRAKMIHRGIVFYKRCSEAQNIISKLALPFIRDEVRILTHSYSRVVYSLISAATQARKRVRVIVTRAEKAPDTGDDTTSVARGEKMVEMLKKIGVPCALILDSAVGYTMDKVDLVLVGAEGVVENGGIINQIGSYQVAVLAKACNKPLYAAVECYKFIRMYPLKQDDLSDLNPSGAGTLEKNNSTLPVSNPWVDYTPPSYISLLFTDLGILTPSAVSDELIKLYS